MPKMKTHRGAAKRFKKTGSGKVKRAQAYTSHILTKKSPKRKRHLRHRTTVIARLKKMLDGCQKLPEVTTERLRRRMGKLEADEQLLGIAPNDVIEATFALSCTVQPVDPRTGAPNGDAITVDLQNCKIVRVFFFFSFLFLSS